MDHPLVVAFSVTLVPSRVAWPLLSSSFFFCVCFFQEGKTNACAIFVGQQVGAVFRMVCAVRLLHSLRPFRCVLGGSC